MNAGLTPLLGQTVTVEMMTETARLRIQGQLFASGSYNDQFQVSAVPMQSSVWSVLFATRQISSIDHDKKLITLKGVAQ